MSKPFNKKSCLQTEVLCAALFGLLAFHSSALFFLQAKIAYPFMRAPCVVCQNLSGHLCTYQTGFAIKLVQVQWLALEKKVFGIQ